MEHKGPVFAPDYEPVPEDVKFYYDGMCLFRASIIKCEFHNLRQKLKKKLNSRLILHPQTIRKDFIYVILSTLNEFILNIPRY